MMEKWLRALRNKKGLTLIELIVVVAIIAVLAVAITPRVLDNLARAKVSNARSLATEIHAAMERFFTDQGATGVAIYPDPPAAGVTMSDVASLTTNLKIDLTGTGNSANLINGDFTYKRATPSKTAYCLIFQAADAKTYFTVAQGYPVSASNPADGVTESTSATAPTCP